MAKQPKQQSSVPQTSLFPFFQEFVQNAHAGIWLAGVYFFLMLFISLKYHIIGDYGVETDFYWSYVPQAKHILRGTLPIEDFHGPLYPIVLSLVALVTSDLFHAGMILSLLSASATLLFIFRILKKLFRADVALIGTIIVALNTTFIQYSYTAGTDMVFNALVTGSLFFLLKDDERTWVNIALSASLAGIGYLTRYNGVFALVAMPAAILLANMYQLTWRERARTAAFFVGIFLLVIAPWGIYCLIEKGSFFYNKNYLNIAYEMFAKGKMGWDQYWSVESQKFTSLRQVIFADPGLFIATVFRNMFDHGADDLGKLLGWQVGIFSLAGIALFVKERPTAQVAGYIIISVLFFGVLLLVFYGERFSMFLLPLYVALALKALTWQKLAHYRFWNRIHIGGVIGIVLVLWTGYNSYQFNSVTIDSGPKEVISIARWFEQNVGQKESGTIIITRKPHIAYYLDMKMELFPYVTTYEELLAKMREVNASYLYFGLMEAGMRPEFRQLLDPRNAPPELLPLTYTVSPPAVLYKIELGAKQ